MKVLLVEDAADVAEVVGFGIRMAWPEGEVTVAGSGDEALRVFAEERPDLVVLDVCLPPPDGFEVCRHIRESSSVPIMMLSVRDATLDKIRALDLGADDYLTKPFDPLELLARMRALLRRAGGAGTTPEGRIVAGDLAIDFARRECACGTKWCG